MHIEEFKRLTPKSFNEYKGIKVGDKIHSILSPHREAVCMAFFRGRYNQVIVAYNDEPRRPNNVCGWQRISGFREFAPPE